jgi:hypothetical protein
MELNKRQRCQPKAGKTGWSRRAGVAEGTEPAPPAPAAGPPPSAFPATAPPRGARLLLHRRGRFPTITDFKPLWLGDALLLTRRVASRRRKWIQGAWLDWPKLRTELLTAVQDRFPNAQRRSRAEASGRELTLLASLPVQLLPGAVAFAASVLESAQSFARNRMALRAARARRPWRWCSAA